MPKAKLKIASNEIGKLTNAAEFSDVQIGNGKKLGEVTLVEVSYRTPAQLFELGRYIDKVSNEVAAAPEVAKAETTKKK